MTGTLTGTPGTLFADGLSFTDYRIQIVASDGFAEAPGEFAFTRNFAPTVSPITVYAEANQYFSRQISGSDPENQTLTYSYTGTLPAGVSLSNTGMLSGTATTAGNYSVSVTVTDASGASSVPATITLNVSPEYPRVINPIPDQSVVQSTAWSYVVPGNTFNNPSGGGITYAAMEVFTVPGHFNAEGYWEDAYDNTRTLPSWITFNPNTRQFSGTAPSTLSSLRVQVAATFTAPASTITDEFVLSVVPPTNNPPVVAKVIPNQTAKQGVNWNFAIPAGTFTDPNGDVLTYSASGYPSGVGFNGTSFTGKPSVSGTFTITVTASDGRPGGVASTSFTVTVVPNDPPVVAKVIPNQTAKQGLNWSFAIPAGTFTDPNGDALTYTAWDYPSGANFNGSSFTGAPSVSGSFTVMVMAMDGRGGTVTTSFTLTVAANNPPVVAKTIPNQSATKGTSWDFPLPAGTFSDPNGDALTYSATGYPSGISFNGSGFTGAPSVTGTFTITVTANDGRPGGVVSTSFTLTVVAPPTPNNNPIVVTPISNKSATKGTTWDFTIPAGTFTDPDGDALTYSASGYPSGVSFTPATRAFSGAPSVTGTFTITVTANDGNGGTTPTTFTLTVNAPANVAPVLVNPIPDQYIDGGTYLSFSVDGTFYDPDSALIYSATGMPAWLTFNATTRVFSGTSGTKFDLTQTITVKATESPAGASATTTFVLSVTNGGSSLLAPDPNTTTASSSPTPAKQKFALGNPSTAHANAEAIEHANTQAGLGAGSAGTGGVSALLAEPGEPGSPPEPPPLTPPQIQTTWYTYDAENRVQVVQGKLENGQIVLGDDIHSSYEQRYDAVGNAVVKIYRTQTDGTVQAQSSQYDLRGNKTTDLAFVRLSEPYSLNTATSAAVAVKYEYSVTGQLITQLEFYAAGTVFQVLARDGSNGGESWIQDVDVSGMIERAEQYSYDADGRLLDDTFYMRSAQTSVVTDPATGHLVIETTWAKEVFRELKAIDDAATDEARNIAQADYDAESTNPTKASRITATNHFYDAAGRAFKYEESSALLFTYTTTFEGRDSYLESTVSGTSSDSRFKPTTNTLTYDAAGRLLSQREHTTLSSGTLPDRMRYYSNNAEGMVQSRRDGRIENGVFVQGDPAHPDDPKPNYQFVNAGGQQLAQLREGGEVTLAATKLQAASTRTEESMLSVAGTSPYAAGGGKVLVQEGDTLSSLAQRVYGNRSLWYVLAQANGLGDPDEALTAGTALNAPSVSVNKNDAGTFRPYNPAEAIGSTSPELPFIDPPKQGCNVLATLIVVAVTAAVMAAMGPAGGGFIGGFVGNLAGQVAGMALGVTDHISLRSAIGSGLTAALTAGIAGKLGGTTSQLVEKAATVGDVSMAKIAASALLTAGANVAGSRVSGTAFSWKAIAANAVSDVVSASLGHALHLKSSDTHGNAGDFRNTFANRMVGGIVSVHTRRQFGFNDRIDYGNIAADAFGNALGNAVAGAIENQRLRKLTSQLNDRALAMSADIQPRLDNRVQAKNVIDPLEGATVSRALTAGDNPQLARIAAVDATAGGPMQILPPVEVRGSDSGYTNRFFQLYSYGMFNHSAVPRVGSSRADLEAVYRQQVGIRENDPRTLAFNQYTNKTINAVMATNGKSFPSSIAPPRPATLADDINRLGQMIDAASMSVVETSHQAVEMVRDFVQDSDSGAMAVLKSPLLAAVAAGDHLLSGLATVPQMFTNATGMQTLAQVINDPRTAAMGIVNDMRNASLEDMALAGFDVLAGGGFLMERLGATQPARLLEFNGIRAAVRSEVANSEAVFTRLSQPGGLRATEGSQVLRYDGRLSEPTHPLYKHGSDVHDTYIEGRVLNELVSKNRTGLRTAFNDRALMEESIAETFSMRQVDIDAWLATSPRAGVPEAFDANPGMGNLGRGFEITTRGGPVVPITRPMPNVNLVLIPDGRGGYLIHTAHPF